MNNGNVIAAFDFDGSIFEKETQMKFRVEFDLVKILKKLAQKVCTVEPKACGV